MWAIMSRISATVMLLGVTGVVTLPAQTVQANATNATTVVLSWTAVTGAERYYIQRAIGSASFSNLSTPRITGTGYTDTGVPANVLVQYRLMTKLANGNFRYSAAVQRRIPGSTGAGAPVATSGGAASQTRGAASPAGGAAPQAGGAASQTGGSAAAAAGAASTGATASAGGAASQTGGPPPSAGGAASPAAGGASPAGGAASAAGGAAPAAGAAPQASATLLPGQPIANVTMAPRDPHQFVAVPSAAKPEPAATTAPAPASSPIPVQEATHGRYRVVANGFSVVQQAHSHHDDVYGGFIMLRFNRQTGELLDGEARHTKVLGDINGRVFGETDGGDFNRLRAGTANQSGGLKNGDSYPDAGHARFRGSDGVAPNRTTFPFEIWSGDLTNGSDAVVIVPTLWSRDGKLSGFDQWQSSELSAGSQIWYDQAVQQALHQTSLGVVAPPGAATPNGSQMFAHLVNLVGVSVLGALGPWALAFALDPSPHDVAIGLDQSGKSLPRRAIVLTREMIEQALNSPKVQLNSTMVVPNYPAWILPYLDVPVGVIPVLLFDYVPPPGEPLRTSYVMYLQVERM